MSQPHLPTLTSVENRPLPGSFGSDRIINASPSGITGKLSLLGMGPARMLLENDRQDRSVVIPIL